jgi:hypothetical protein
MKDNKTFGTAIYPVHALETSGLMRRAEPLLTPEKLKSRYLKGINLTLRNGDKITDDDLKDRIMLAQNTAEMLLGTTIFPEGFKDKLPFDWSLYKAFIHIRSEHKPIISLEALQIVSSDDQVIFEIPAQWIEASNFSKGLINVVPLLAAFGATSATGSPITATSQGAGIAFLAIWGASGNSQHIPAYWQFTGKCGLSSKEGQVPVIVNELIGVIATIDLLSTLAPQFMFTSQSMSQDGLGQSSSGFGPKQYELRISELEKKREELIRKIKGIFQTKYFIGNI